MKVRHCSNCKNNQFTDAVCCFCYNDGFSKFEPATEQISKMLKEEDGRTRELLKQFICPLD